MKPVTEFNKPRLDNYLVELGYFPSRSRARDAIVRGTVTVEGVTVTKASLHIRRDASIGVRDPAQKYVSRAALKLATALEAFDICVRGKPCLDVGASTGGFTQVLLENGATHVVALDVGHGQMDQSIRSDTRVTVLEGLNARDLTGEHLNGHFPGIIVSDVSFISLKIALPPALKISAKDARCVLLVKPQFEVGRERVGKGGIVKPEDGKAVAHELKDWLDSFPDWKATKLMPSPIAGGDGNLEYLLAGQRNG